MSVTVQGVSNEAVLSGGAHTVLAKGILILTIILTICIVLAQMSSESD